MATQPHAPTLRSTFSELAYQPTTQVALADAAPSVLVDSDARTRVAVRPFLHDGVLALSVVVKVALDISKQGPARRIDPRPIDELALGKETCDVTLVGSAVAPHGVPARTLVAALGLYRNGATLIEKTVVARGPLDRDGQATLIASSPLVWEHAFGGSGGGLAGQLNPAGTDHPRLVDPTHPRLPACFAPIDPASGYRRSRVDPRTLASFSSGLPELPATFPWEHFQSAPSDQRVPFLQGDEWISLEGMHAKVPSLRSRLPWLHDESMIVDPSGIRKLSLSLDTLSIDADALEASLVYRGMIKPTRPLHELLIVGRIGTKGEAPRPIDLRDLMGRARRQPLEMPRVSAAPPASGVYPATSRDDLAAQVLRQSGLPADIVDAIMLDAAWKTG